MLAHWNERYSHPEYAYGTAPNEWFKYQLAQLPAKGRILLPAEGEGRNAVYAAQEGWEVHAFDPSKAGRDKALSLAQKESVLIDYKCGFLEEMPYQPESFDAIGLIFAHLPQDQQAFHKRLTDLLRPGGYVILEAFSRSNLSYREKNPSIGGPPKLEMLFTTQMIKEHFVGFETLYLKEEEVQLNEGRFHQGTGMVIRFLGQKL